MYFFPWATVRICSSDKPAILKGRLEATLDKYRWFRFGSSDGKELEGKMEGDSFKLQRIISYRNSFRPVFIGRFEERSGETIVHVKMRLHYLIIVFSVLWTLICSVGLIGTCISVYRGESPAAIALIPFVMLLLFWSMSSIFFHLERRRTENVFMRIWDVTISR